MIFKLGTKYDYFTSFGEIIIHDECENVVPNFITKGGTEIRHSQGGLGRGEYASKIFIIWTMGNGELVDREKFQKTFLRGFKPFPQI